MACLCWLCPWRLVSLKSVAGYPAWLLSCDLFLQQSELTPRLNERRSSFQGICQSAVSTATYKDRLHYDGLVQEICNSNVSAMGLLSDTQNCGLRMHRECRERFPRHWLQRKPLVSDPGMHHGTCVTHVPRCMLGSLTGGGGENVPGIPGTCATRNFAYLVRGPWSCVILALTHRHYCHPVRKRKLCSQWAYAISTFTVAYQDID